MARLEDSKDIHYKNGNGIFFTSDTHFGHTKIIEYCGRPYKDAEEMNDALVENWNSVVGKDDTVFHLGDFAFGGIDVWTQALDRLNGKIHLILGNHDLKNMNTGLQERFESVVFQKQIYIGNRCLILNHYPMLTYGGVYREGDKKVYQLFGHVHSGPMNRRGKDNPRLQHLLPSQYDVGVDGNNFTPVAFADIERIIRARIEASENKDKDNE